MAALLVGLLCGVAACAGEPLSAPPSPPEPPPAESPKEPPAKPNIYLTQPFPDLTFEAGDPVHTLYLDNYFGRTLEAGKLQYEALTDGRAVVVAVRPLSRIDVEPVQPGHSQVVVTASGAEGSIARDTFAVTVTPPSCPPGSQPGEVDFLPLEPGARWTFEFTRTEQIMANGRREEGTLTLTLGTSRCLRGTRTVSAEERRVGREIRSIYLGSTIDTTALDVRRSVTLVETEQGVQLPWSQGVVERYHPAETDTVYAEAGPYERCTTRGSQVTLVPGGVVSFSGGCAHASHSYGLEFTRQKP